ncbi:hypothetical protein [Actinomadura rupiterrae]|uniref:hypothetical protein n=1 Tax=Actinomadura rupiterrae TaxID=559627 RepID=UPI0020A2DC30|nr:hypothetical protein [Actinomadura rupiterrae]MCP2342909.1 hypothetical protein [Actinomadura rupiterrae]
MIGLRDEAEAVLRGWHAYEVARGAAEIIDFDCAPSAAVVEPVDDRIAVRRRLVELRGRASGWLASRLDADIAFAGALLGERPPLREYVRATQGCDALGWTDEYLAHRRDLARDALDAVGVSWGPGSARELRNVEGRLPNEDAPDAIRAAADEFEQTVRGLAGTTAPFSLAIESADVDAYWAYWLDGAGSRVRLRLNLRNITFSEVAARQFALHEVLGHGLQSASWSAHAAAEDVPWARLMSVHAPHQVLLEGLAQALPLFAAPDDPMLRTRVRFDHYNQLVRGRLHLALNAGAPVEDLVDQARRDLPWAPDDAIADVLTDRGVDPRLRSYLWAYPAGVDWFVSLAEAGDPELSRTVLRAAYRDPLTPSDLAALWPEGPAIGGGDR